MGKHKKSHIRDAEFAGIIAGPGVKRLSKAAEERSRQRRRRRRRNRLEEDSEEEVEKQKKQEKIKTEKKEKPTNYECSICGEFSNFPIFPYIFLNFLLLL